MRKVEGKRRSARSKKLSRADEQDLKVVFLRNRKKQSNKDLRDASGPPADPHNPHLKLLFQIKISIYAQ